MFANTDTCVLLLALTTAHPLMVVGEGYLPSAEAQGQSLSQRQGRRLGSGWAVGWEGNGESRGSVLGLKGFSSTSQAPRSQSLRLSSVSMKPNV